jgi:hypothetical protein
MKHLKLLFVFGVFIGLVATSCSNEPKLLTEAEVAKKVADMTSTKTQELEAKLDQACTANMDNMVNTLVDSIVMAKQAEMTVPAKK